jgi:hypothetical protein
MDAPERGALMLVRFVGLALMGWALAEFALYFVVARQKGLPIEVLPCVIKSLPFIAGIVVLIKAQALAEWISNLLDD